MKDETPETSEPLMLSPNLDCEGEHTERLSGSREPLPAFAEDADAPVSLEAFAFSIRRAPSGRALKVGDVFHPLRDRKERKGVFVREGYAVPTVGLEAFAFSIRRAPSGRALKVGDVFHPLRDRKERKGVFVREGYAVPTVGGPDVAFSIRRAPSGRALKVGDVFHPLRDRKERKGVFVREGYAVPTVGGPDVLVLHLRKWLLLLPLALCAVLLAFALRTCGTTSQAPAPHYMDGQTQTEGVLHLRKWLLLLPLALCAVLLAFALRTCGTTSQAPAPHYMDGQTQTEGAEPSQPVASIEYASYEATMDGEWRANAIDQIFSLSLPASSTHGGTTGKNPVDSSPSIYVDINADGDFEPDECVYNAPDSSGYGHLLRAGSRVDSIELVRPLDAGTYSALTVWRSVLAGTSTPAGHTSFAWTLTVS